MNLVFDNKGFGIPAEWHFSLLLLPMERVVMVEYEL